MKLLVGTFNQEKALVGAFPLIVKTDGSFSAIADTHDDLVPVAEGLPVPGAVPLVRPPLVQPEVGLGHVPRPLHPQPPLLTHPHIVAQPGHRGQGQAQY